MYHFFGTRVVSFRLESLRLLCDLSQIDSFFLPHRRSPATLQETTPLKQPCVADYGGPVFPYLAVGGQGDVSARGWISAISFSSVWEENSSSDFQCVWQSWCNNFIYFFAVISFSKWTSLRSGIFSQPWRTYLLFRVENVKSVLKETNLTIARKAFE